MKPTTKRPLEEAPDGIATMAMDMIAAGEKSRVLESYVLDLSLVVTPVFKETSKRGARK